jgi:phenylalanyl-tRNA synthetase beta chain
MSFGATDVKLFEVGKVYCTDESSRPRLVENFLEEQRVCFVLSGNRVPLHWSLSADPSSIFDLKGDVTDLLHKFALDKSGFISYPTSNRLAEYAIAIEINGSYAGYFGSVSEEFLKRFGIEQPVFVADLSIEVLRPAKQKAQYHILPKYPRVQRDVAFVVKEATPAGDVERIIREASSRLLQAVSLFDIYRGENLTSGNKSLAFRLDLMSPDRTLTDAEIDSEVERIVEAVVRKTGAVLRAV